MHAEKAFFSISLMARVLGVSRQGYYAWLARRERAAERLACEHELQRSVQRVFEESRRTYGSPRVHAHLRRDGIRVSKRRVERAMRGGGLVARPRRGVVRTTIADGTHGIAENVLDRNFSASKPNERWVTDISYVQTDEGWSYLAVILDLFSRRVVGWALDVTLATSLQLEALEMAVRTRRPTEGLLHHSDRGCQYTSSSYRARLDALGISVSMSRKGNCWDNAVAESFFATLKTELGRRRWRSHQQLRSAVFEYIETFYNRRRLHSAIGYKTPAEVEREHALAAA